MSKARKSLDFTLGAGKNAMILKIDDFRKVTIYALATKQLQKTPLCIKNKLYDWIERVKFLGAYEVRKIKSYHDEPLKGERAGHAVILVINIQNTLLFAEFICRSKYFIK